MDEYIDLAALRDNAVAEYPANYLYCLADHAGMPGLYRELLKTGTPWASLFQGASEEGALATAPQLFPMEGQDDGAGVRLLQWLAAHGTYTSSLLLLSSPLGPDALRERLARRLLAQVSEGMDVLLRFFDPRIFESLLTVLNTPQRDNLLSPADCWWYCDRDGVLQKRLSEYGDIGDDVLLHLSAAQEFALLDASEIDQVAEQLQTMLPDAYLGIGPAFRASFLRREMAAARTFGIGASHEVALYCGLVLLYGEDFAQASDWQALLARVRDGSTGFADAVAAAEES